jgi:hypothetical protein
MSRADSLKKWADNNVIIIRVKIEVEGSFPSVGGSSSARASSSAGGFAYTPKWSGGYIGKDEAILVGENGPELMITQNSGRVLSNGESQRALGGGSSPTVIYNFRDATLDTEEIMRTMQRALDLAGGYA